MQDIELFKQIELNNSWNELLKTNYQHTIHVLLGVFRLRPLLISTKIHPYPLPPPLPKKKLLYVHLPPC